MPHVLDGGRRVLAEQALSRHHLAGRAVAALERVILGESLLHRAQLLALHQSLDRRDLVAVRLHRQRHAGVARLPVDEHRARAALAPLASDLRPGQAEPVAQHVQQRPTGLDQHLVPASVDRNRHRAEVARLQGVRRRGGRRALHQRTGSRHANRPGSHRGDESAAAHAGRRRRGFSLLVVAHAYLPGFGGIIPSGLGPRDSSSGARETGEHAVQRASIPDLEFRLLTLGS